jgi:hypothetical protein
MSMPFTISHPLGRPPAFSELQELAKQYEVQIIGDEHGGNFWHPNQESPKANGKYTLEENGDLRGEFTGYALGKITGIFIAMTGKAEITIEKSPLLMPTAVLKPKLTEALKAFCAKFPPAV